MSHAVCYVERTGLGAALTGVRVISRRAAKQWAVGSAPKTGAAVLEATAAAARWIVEQTTGASGGVKRTTICVDLDATVCSWMTVPSPDARFVRAAAQAVQVGAGTDEGGGHSGTWLSHGSVGLDLSVQALVERPVTDSSGKLPAVLRQRLGVLAAPDLAVRALLDELDRLSFTPERVISLWHAMAEAWASPTASARPSDDDRVVASDELTTAVVLVEPSGRLHWCWARSGTLLAAGSMRLRRSESAPESAPEADQPDRRAARPINVLEVSRSDIGRVVGEWLGWSIELGLAPARIVCLGPDTITCAGLDADLPEASGVSAIGQSLGHAWPGTVVAAEVLDDPVGVTLTRIAERLDDDDGPSASAPSAEIEDLSARPGRSSRRMYQWLAAAIVMAAVVVGAIGYRLSGDAAQVREQIEEIKTKRAELITGIKPLVPKINEADPIPALRAKRGELETDAKQITTEQPVIPELIRALQGAAQVPKVELITCTVMSSLASFQFQVLDPDSPGRVLEAINALPSGPNRLKYTTTIQFAGEKGTLNLKGTWEEAAKPGAPAKPATPAATPASAAPATKPAALPATTPATSVSPATIPSASTPPASTPPTTPPTKPDGGPS